MVKFLEIQGPNCRETHHCPLPKATHVCQRNFLKEEQNPKEKAQLHQRNQVFSFFHYGNTHELGATGQFVTSLDSSGSVRPACFKPGLLI